MATVDFAYARNIWPLAEKNAPCYWVLTAQRDGCFRIVNYSTGRALYAKGCACALGENEGPEAQWAFDRAYCGYFIRNAAHGTVLSRTGNGSLCLIETPVRATARWQIDYPDRRFDARHAGSVNAIAWAGRTNTRRTYTTRACLATRVIGVDVETEDATQRLTIAPGQSVVVAIAVEGSGGLTESCEPDVEGLLHHLPHGLQIAHAAGYRGFIMLRALELPGVHGPGPAPSPVAPGESMCLIRSRPNGREEGDALLLRL